MKKGGFFFALLLVSVFFFINFSAVSATNYYVNATTGSDSNNGTSPLWAWQTIAHVNAASFSPGDNIYFEQGQVWREQLTVPSSGNATNQITFGAYGAGSQPVISGSDLETLWTSEAVGAPARVQVTSSRSNSSSFVTAPYTNTPIQGDLLIAAGKGTTLIGNASITGWTLAVSTLYGASSTLGIWYKIANASESKNVTLNWTGSTSTELDISEWSNVNNTSTLDQIASTPTNGSAVTSISSGTTPTTTVSNELLYAVFRMGSAVTNEAFSNSFVEDNFTTSAGAFFGATKIVSSTGAYETTASWTTARIAGGIIATFKGSGSVLFTAYKKTLASKPLQVFVNGTRIQQVANKTNMTNGTWYWDSGTSSLYVRTPGDDNASGYAIEASLRDMAVDVYTDNVSNVKIQNLNLSQAKKYDVWMSGNSTTVQNCTVHDSFIKNIVISGLSSGAISTSSAVYDSDVYGAGSSGIAISGNFSGVRIQRNTIHGNSQLINNMTGGSSEQQNSAGILVYIGNNQTASAGSDTIISNNSVYNNGPASWIVNDNGASARSAGIWIDTVKIPTFSPLIIEYNTVYGNDGGGIFLEKTQRVGAYYNVVYNNANEPFTGNIWVSANSGTTSLGAWVYNNAVYGTGYYSIYLDGTSSLTNLSFENNIISPTNATGSYVYIAGNAADIPSGNIIDYNVYGTGITFNINDHFGTLGAGYPNLTGWQTASGQDVHSFNADPLFTNVSNNDFTLQPSSPAIDAGLNLGTPYNLALAPGSTWPNNISLLDQGNYGSGWDLGAYVYVDSVSPTVTLPVYTNKTSYQNSQSLTFNLNVADDISVSSCSVNVNGNSNQTLSASSGWCNGTYSLSGLSDGYPVINAYVNDTSGNTGLNNSYSLQIYSPAAEATGSTGGGGGGGGGSSTATTTTENVTWVTSNVSDSDFAQGYTAEIPPNSRFVVQVDSQDHYVGVVSISGNEAIIQISSNAVNVTLSPGQNASVDVNDDSFYDIFVLLNGVTGNQANLTVQKIHVPVTTVGNAVQTNGETQEQPTTTEKKSLSFVWILALVIIIAAIIFFGIKAFKRIKYYS